MKPVREKRRAAPRKRSRGASPAVPSQSASRSQAKVLPVSTPSASDRPQWTFLTNHGHVLVLLSRDPTVVLREVALQVGITERAVQRIIADLEASGIINREKIGRQNQYRIRTEQPLRHSVESHRTIGELLDLINGTAR